MGLPITLELPGPGAAAVAMSEGSARNAGETAMLAADVALARVRGGRTLVDEDVREHGPGEAARDGRTGIAVGRHAVRLQRVEVPGQSVGDCRELGLVAGKRRIHGREVGADRSTRLQCDAGRRW